MKLEFSREIFEKCSNIKYHKIRSSRSRVVPCGQTEDRQTRIIYSRCFAILRNSLKMVQKRMSLLIKGEYDLLGLHATTILNVLLKCSYFVINIVLLF
jgi:hypothetical protein